MKRPQARSRHVAAPRPGPRFAALDVETANADPASICQVGIARVKAGQLDEVWTRLVRPPGRFAPGNVRIHGITPDTVLEAPSFREIRDEIATRLPEVAVTHTRFDVAALTQACRRNRLPMFKRLWLDSSRLPAVAWPRRFRHGPRGLRAIALELGIEFRHHDAGEDARAAAEITLRCMAASGASIGDWARDLGISTHRKPRSGSGR